MSLYLNCEQVAERLGIEKQTVARMCNAGRIPGAFITAKKAGWRIPEKSLERFVSSLSRRTEARNPIKR